MFESIRNDAISVHNNCSVLLLVAPDVDAICAARVLTVRSASRCGGAECV